MQLNPARGRKRARMIARSLRVTLLVYAAQPREGTETDEEALTSIGSGKKVYAAQPREGTETPIRDFEQTWIPNEVYAAQPREGTETSAYPSPPSIRVLWFMQLNPARGRKLIKSLDIHGMSQFQVYAAQPREGTETIGLGARQGLTTEKVYAAQPREGTETSKTTVFPR